MSNYIRSKEGEGCYFITFNLEERKNTTLLIDNIQLLRNAVKYTLKKWPFKIEGIVVLPDHVHILIRLSNQQSDYSKIIRSIKDQFSRNLKAAETISSVRRARKERGIWQRRFWEHTIVGQNDFNKHMDYIHWNPVKHGYVKSVKEWPHSSFHHLVEKGVYTLNWGLDVESTISGSMFD